MPKKTLNSGTGNGLREKAEKRLAKKPIRESRHDPALLLHELEVHQVELEMQNEELRRSRLEIEESRQKYFDLYDLAPVGYLTLNEYDVISELNLTAAGLLGVGRGALVDKPFSRFVPAESRDAFYCHRRKVLESSTKQTCELVLRKNDDTYFNAQLDSIGIKINGKRAMRTILTDITERTRAEEARLESERRYHSLVESSLDGIMLTQQDGTILSANKRMCEMLLMSEEEVLRAGRGGMMVDDEKLRAAISERAKTGKWQGELTARRSDGSTFPVEVSSRVFVGTDGREMTSMAIRDITERKQAQDEIKSLLNEKELLLKEVHHRIRNNMSVIMSLLSLQSGRLEDPSAISALEDAESRVRSMMVLYDRLYRSSDFREVATREYFASLIDEIVGNFSYRELVVVEKHLDDFRLSAEILSPVGIILNELLTNAMKYAFNGRENGKIFVSLTVENNHVTLLVRDNGVGVPQSIDIVASPGFGMHLVDMLTEQLDGTIRLERGKGSTFILEFDV